MLQESQTQEKNKKEGGKGEVSSQEYPIRTMRADLARLRLSEAKQERKKIIDLQEQQPRAEKAKISEPEQLRPDTVEKDIESVIIKKGLERKKIILLEEQAGLRQNINAINKNENEINQGIAKINRQKKLVQNEDQIKELNRQKEEFLDKKQALQADKIKYQKRLQDLEKELQETGIKSRKAGIGFEKEAKIETPAVKKELSDIEMVAQAKQRLEKLTQQQEKMEGRQDSTFRETLETRWEEQPGKKILPGIEVPPIKPVKEYPSKPTKETLKWRRITIVSVSAVFIILTGAFLFWFFTKNPLPAAPPPLEPPVTPEEPEGPEEPEKPEEPIPSIGLLPVDEEETIEIQDNAQIGPEIEKALAKSQEQEILTRFLFKNTAESSFVDLPGFFQVFDIKTPEGLLEKLENYSTFFIYSYSGVNRFGFAAKIKEGENADEQMRRWEETMEPDTDGLLKVLGKEDSAGTNIFRVADHKGVQFRYLSIGKKDFGICWTQYKGRLVFTTSGKTMLKIIDALQYE